MSAIVITSDSERVCLCCYEKAILESDCQMLQLYAARLLFHVVTSDTICPRCFNLVGRKECGDAASRIEKMLRGDDENRVRDLLCAFNVIGGRMS